MKILKLSLFIAVLKSRSHIHESNGKDEDNLMNSSAMRRLIDSAAQWVFVVKMNYRP